MAAILRLLARRVKSERGSVGVLIALVIFGVCGMLAMTWNTAQLSKEKMRVQNAADAAALEFCLWQARGMNSVQNINDEAWIVFDTGQKLLKYTVQVESVLSSIPLPIVRGALEFGLCLIPGAVSGMMTHWCGDRILKAASYFYVYGSCAFGMIGAQQLACKNGASSLLRFLPGNGEKKIGKTGFSLGLYSVGVSMAMHRGDMLWLPLWQDQDPGSPFVHTENETEMLPLKTSTWRSVYKLAGTGKSWKFKPFVSKPKKYSEKTEKKTEKKKEKKKEKKPKPKEKPKPKGKSRETQLANDKNEGIELQTLDEQGHAIKAPVEAADPEDLPPAPPVLDAPDPEPADSSSGKPPKDPDGGPDGLGPRPSPTIWLAMKFGSDIRTIQLTSWSGEKQKDDILNHPSTPVIALAAARCVTGDVVKHNKEPDKYGKFKGVVTRPVGFGAGATAKLIPVAEALKEIPKAGKAISKIIGTVVYH